MSLTLGGVTLSDSTIWADRDSYSPVAMSRTQTLGMKQVVRAVAVPKGRTITLQGVQDTGWVTKAVVDQLQALADAVGATYTLNFNGTQYTVMFKHDDPPAFSAAPLVYRNNQAQTDYYTWEVKLVTV